MNKLIILPLILFLLISCVKNEESTLSHSGEVTYSQSTLVQDNPKDFLIFESIYNEKDTYYNKIKNDEIDLEGKIIAPLSKYFFDANFVLDKEYTARSEFKSAFNIFNAAILKLLNSTLEQKKDIGKMYAKKYFDAILKICDNDFNACSGLGFFRSDSFSSKILMVSVVTEYDKLMKVLKGNDKKSDTFVTQFNKVFEYSILTKLISVRNDNQLNEIFFSLVNIYEQIQGNEEVVKIEDRFNIKIYQLASMELPQFDPTNSSIFDDALLYSRKDKLKGNFNYAGGDFLSMASQKIFIDEKKNKEIFKNLIRKISNPQKGNYFFINEKISNVRSGNADKNLDELDPFFTFKKDDIAALVKTLDSDKEKSDIALFIANRLFQGHYNVEDASDIWSNYIRNSNNKLEEEAAFLATVQKFIELHIYYNTITSTNMLKNYYATHTGTIASRFEETINSSRSINLRWEDVMTRISKINNFINAHFSSRNENYETYKQITSNIDFLRENIKIFSILPNMIYFSTILAGSEKISVKSNDINEITIDGNEVTKFFNENETPWFFFGNNDTPLSVLKSEYSLYYLFSLGLFKSYDPKQSVDEFQILDHVISKLFVYPRNKLLKILTG